MKTKKYLYYRRHRYPSNTVRKRVNRHSLDEGGYWYLTFVTLETFLNSDICVYMRIEAREA